MGKRTYETPCREASAGKHTIPVVTRVTREPGKGIFRTRPSGDQRLRTSDAMTGPNSGLHNHRHDHRPAAMGRIDPPTHHAPHSLLEVVRVVDAVG